jgi:hypothetical protein
MPDGGACVAPKDALQADYHADSELTVMADACFDGFRSARCAAPLSGLAGAARLGPNPP